jgi:C-terminal processing protease CtpA/Prc
VAFTGPAALLTGQRSVSAAETFTMSLMGRQPGVIRIGESTQGVFSDVLTRSLPNGWRFGLANERFLTEEGDSFDGPGIPPHHEVPVFSPRDLDSGVDPGLERALEWLAESSRGEEAA